MPRMSLSAAAADDGQVDRFDTLKLEKGEQHRLWIPDEDGAAMEKVHNVRAPVFEEGGKPLTTEKKVKGGFKTVFDMDDGWLGSPICLGDLEGRELDADNCPTCAGVKRMLDAGIGDARDLLAQQRWAVPVIRYETLNKWDVSKGLQTPPTAKIFVWRLSQWSLRQVNSVRGQAAELLGLEDAKAVKLQYVDLCVANENGFQKIDRIWPSPRAWAHNSDPGRAAKAFIAALWGNEENRPTDAQLRAACGKEPDREWMERDIANAEERWHRAWNYGKEPARGSGVPLSGGKPGQSVADQLDDLLVGHPGGLEEFAPAAGASAVPVPADDDIFGGSAPAPAAAPPSAPAPAADPFADDIPAPPAASNGSARPVQSFDDILA